MIDLKPFKIKKQKFKQQVFKRCKNVASKHHVFNIVNILLDELSNDLYYKKEKIKIKNFCTISIKKTKPKNFFSIWYQKKMISTGKNQVVFKLFEPLKKILYSYIDKD